MENTPGSVWKPSGLVILHTTQTSPRGPSNPERQVSASLQNNTSKTDVARRCYKWIGMGWYPGGVK